jgi:hypothetical protein
MFIRLSSLPNATALNHGFPLSKFSEQRVRVVRVMQTGFYFWERFLKKKALMFAVALLASLLALR